jgi:hypothetical protein
MQAITNDNPRNDAWSLAERGVLHSLSKIIDFPTYHEIRLELPIYYNSLPVANFDEGWETIRKIK